MYVCRAIQSVPVCTSPHTITSRAGAASLLTTKGMPGRIEIILAAQYFHFCQLVTRLLARSSYRTKRVTLEKALQLRYVLAMLFFLAPVRNSDDTSYDVPSTSSFLVVAVSQPENIEQ